MKSRIPLLLVTVLVLSLKQAGAQSTSCSAPFFSEYIEGSSNNKGFEIYNPTNTSLDLGPYKVYLSGNGGSYLNEFNLSGTVAAGDVYVITTDQADPVMLGQADTALAYPSVAHYNGDDALFLVDTVMSDTLDIIGVIGVDPGTNWAVDTGATSEYTLVRDTAISAGQTNWTVGATEWIVYPQNTYTYFGSHTSACVSTIPANPTINFALSSLIVNEDTGTVTVNLLINPTASTAESVDLQFVLGANVNVPADGTVSPAPNFTTGILTLSVPANEDTVSFDLNVVDDAVIEGNETLFVSINTVSSGLTVGSTNNSFVVVADNDAAPVVIPTYNIADVTTNDANGVADSLNVGVRLHGVVFSTDFDGNSGYQIYIYDNTGGINVYSPTDLNGYTSPMRGDSLRLIGTIIQYNGLTEIQPDSLVLLSTGHTLKTPELVFDLGEDEEGELIRMNGYILLNPSQWTGSGSGFNVDITNGTDTFVMRVDNDANLFSKPAPVGYFDVIGVGSQFDNSSPYTEGYQIFPRDTNDIIPVELPQLAITEIMPGSNHSADPDGDWFEVTNYGSTAIDIQGYSWDDDSREAGKHMVGASFTINANESVIFLDVLSSDVTDWTDSWAQTSNGIKVLNTDDEFNGFSGLSKNGDEITLYDAGSRIVSRVAFTSSTDGFSFEVVNDSVTGNSVDGVNGAYTSRDGDVGSPGNMTPVSLKEFADNKLSLYPNPANEVVFVETGSNAAKTVTISSITGNTIAQFNSTNTLVKIDATGLVRGVYIVTLEMDGETYARKVVVE